jgi:hypothetical protein
MLKQKFSANHSGRAHLKVVFYIKSKIKHKPMRHNFVLIRIAKIQNTDNTMG